MLERVHDSYEYPTDLPAGEQDSAGALRWTIGVIAITSVLLALTNAGAVSGWAGSFDPQPHVMPLVRAADRWDAATRRLGLATPHARMHAVWRDAEKARWSPQGSKPAAVSGRQ